MLAAEEKNDASDTNHTNSGSSFSGEGIAQTPVRDHVNTNTSLYDAKPSTNRRIFDLRAAAGFRPKAPRDNLPDMVRVDCGEDAFYIRHHLGYASMGLSDGVGGWGSLGVDSSLFAWDLMHQCEKVFANAATEATKVPESVLSPSPQYILEQGYSQVVDRGVVTAGSSTACVVVFEKDQGTLLTTNLGDSGLMVFRQNPIASEDGSARVAEHTKDENSAEESSPTVSDWEMEGIGKLSDSQQAAYDEEQSSIAADDDDSINDGEAYIATLPFRPVFSTTERQHYFNAPYQLSILPPSMANNPNNITDSPSDAVQSNVPLENGDVIVMASDGLWDNMYWEEVVHLLERELGPVKDLVSKIQEGFEKGLHGDTPLEKEQSEVVIDGQKSQKSHSKDADFGTLPTPISTPHPPEADETDLGVRLPSLEKSTGLPDQSARDGSPQANDDYAEEPSPGVAKLNLDLNGVTNPSMLLQVLDERVGKFAACLTDQAASLARDTRRASPFAKSARSNGKFYIGGKVDDITIIVGVVVKLPNYAANSSAVLSTLVLSNDASSTNVEVSSDYEASDKASSTALKEELSADSETDASRPSTPPPPPASPTDNSSHAKSDDCSNDGLEILANASLSA